MLTTDVDSKGESSTEIAVNPLANPDNWELVYAECRDEHVWTYTGPEAQPWKLAEGTQ